MPWEHGNFDGPYNMWKWYTANMLCSIFSEPQHESEQDALARRIAGELRTLSGASEAEAESWIQSLTVICESAIESAENMLRSACKHWVVWRPHGYNESTGFPVTETTDEGRDVLMDAFQSHHFKEPADCRDLEGKLVQLVAQPAMARTILFSREWPMQFAAPMVVVLEDHLGPPAQPLSSTSALEAGTAPDSPDLPPSSSGKKIKIEPPPE